MQPSTDRRVGQPGDGRVNSAFLHPGGESDHAENRAADKVRVAIERQVDPFGPGLIHERQ